ncbi:hypothetical protein [Pedosphaera parvula]|uniref:Nickel/cobalt efflux system n=1 Tax=Pedosphaera parvula (strain Ellin514) TaxID=320771 RepID=B9XAS7_PEDPL|nr:hypothetical protein [Pedosphaera parvula]EEF63112.1 high-affinity nickel-transporter [Pedosphaera parvula Ellin514]
MMTLLSFLFLGFFLGMRHAMDADHVVAVTTIVSRERTIRNAAMIGIVWGIGHTLTLLLAGGMIIFLGVVVPTRLGLSLEFSVALMLILLGFLNFKNFAASLTRSTGMDGMRPNEFKPGDVAQHEGFACDHLREAELQACENRVSGWRFLGLELKWGHLSSYQTLRPLIIGIVHGLAGSAAVALLVLPLIQKPFWAIAYLMIFGGGTIGGMMLITAAMALPFSRTARRSPAFHRNLGLATGFLSIGFGLFLVYQIGFVEGLFTK